MSSSLLLHELDQLSSNLGRYTGYRHDIDSRFSHIPSPSDQRDVVIIGGGQSALAWRISCAELNFRSLSSTQRKEPGGAWRHGWNSLRLFSPSTWSSIPGWMMPPVQEGYPTRNHVIDYLNQYEQRYRFPVERPVRVTALAGAYWWLTSTFRRPVLGCQGCHQRHRHLEQSVYPSLP